METNNNKNFTVAEKYKYLKRGDNTFEGELELNAFNIWESFEGGKEKKFEYTSIRMGIPVEQLKKWGRNHKWVSRAKRRYEIYQKERDKVIARARVQKLKGKTIMTDR